MPLRLAGHLRGDEGTELDRPVRRSVVAAWRRAVAGWHREARRLAPFSETEFDGVEHLAAWLDRVDDGDDTDCKDAACAGSGSGLLDPQVTALQPETFPPDEAGERPTEVIRLLKDRLYGVHLKDFAEMQNKTKGVILGRGHIDVPAVFETLVEVGFPADGALSVEYEENPQNPLDDLRECHRVASEALARG